MDGAQKTVAYTYDPVGNRSRMTDPDDGRCTYAYDANSQLTVLRNPQEDRTSFSYDVAGRRTLKELANGTRATMIYDAAGSLTRIANLKSDNSVISQSDYSYNAAGKRTRIVSADGSVTTYSYDSLYQLTREQRSASNSSWSGLTVDGWGDLTADGWSTLQGNDAYDQQYQYDANLNRTVKDLDGTRTTVTYDAADQIRYQLNAAGRTTYTFDANGNEILVLTPTGERTTTVWNYENSPVVTATPDKGTQTSVYDPDNVRVKKLDQDGTTRFIYDGQAYLLETNGSNVTVAVYTQEPTTYGYVASQYRLTNGVWTPSYYQQDALGSTLQLTDAAQNVTDTWLYDAWGEVLARTGETVNPFEWIGAWGYYKDQATGLYYVRARDMRSSDGRWRRPDPLLFVDGPNLYVLYFVPNGVDPSGEIAIPLPPPTLIPPIYLFCPLCLPILTATAVITVIVVVTIWVLQRKRDIKQIDDIVKEYCLNDKQRRRLHDELQREKQGRSELDRETIIEVLCAMFPEKC